MQNAAVTPSTEDKFAKEPSSVESSDFYRFAKDTPSADPSAFAPDRAYLFADPVPANENSFCAGDGERDGDCDAPAPSSFQLAPNAEAVTTQPAFSINLKTPHPDPLNANPAKRTLALSPEPEGQPKKQKLFL
uniref:Uncharacterized protein n=1 Tax=Pinguiococcus pyrenoidosus TaxID=172671 RepID=A0A7R9YC54_9STRA